MSASFQNALVLSRLGSGPRLVCWMGSGPSLMGWIGSGVRVKDSFHILSCVVVCVVVRSGFSDTLYVHLYWRQDGEGIAYLSE